MPKLENLGDYVKTVKSVAPISVNAGAVTATAVDGRGYARARHVVIVGLFGATAAGFDAEITESTASGGTYTLIASSGLTAVATNSGAGKVYVMDVPVNSAKPYQKLRATTYTSTVVIASICDLYNAVSLPPTQTWAEEVTV